MSLEERKLLAALVEATDRCLDNIRDTGSITKLNAQTYRTIRANSLGLIAQMSLAEHSKICPQCAGPDDGCEVGQRLEERELISQGRPYGYNCPVCGESIDDSQPVEHTDQGLAHSNCCEEESK